jgi:hypothetical protein
VTCGGDGSCRWVRVPGPVNCGGVGSCWRVRVPGPTTYGGAGTCHGSRVPVPSGHHGPPDQGVTGSPGLEPLPCIKGRELPGPAPMEIDASEPPPPRGGTVQRPVYFIGEVPHEAKTRYLEVHKLLYVVLIASRKLHHYFQAHKISVVT